MLKPIKFLKVPTTTFEFKYLSWGAATRKGDLLYLHVTDWPENGKLNVPLSSKVQSAALLVNPDTPLAISVEAERIVIDLPSDAPDEVASVIILKLDEEPVAMPIASSGKAILASKLIKLFRQCLLLTFRQMLRDDSRFLPGHFRIDLSNLSSL